MVDLVKIRKKAREKKEAPESPAGAGAPPAAGSESDGPQKQSAERKRTKAKKAKKASASRTSNPSAVPTQETVVGEAGPSQEAAPALDKSSDRAGTDAVRSQQIPGQEAGLGHGESRLARFKRTAGLMERDDAVDEADARTETGDGQLELLTFVLAGEHYAMEVGRLVEILVPRSWTRVPNADDDVIGIISLRGSIVTLLDLRRLLGHEGRDSQTEDTRIIVVQKGEERLGFIVDRVLRVVKVGRESIEPPPVVSSSEQNEAVSGVFMTGETITIHLDLDQLGK